MLQIVKKSLSIHMESSLARVIEADRSAFNVRPMRDQCAQRRV
jgi:hypothetical protein